MHEYFLKYAAIVFIPISFINKIATRVIKLYWKRKYTYCMHLCLQVKSNKIILKKFKELLI